ncbi:DnaT-like ssDNA-binding protein [Gilliamella sp. BG7]|uniref:DnaT-like ssDNA-binding protein n=1 Tax=unclassified Gilliamella TaxID=2685620 RepID=UPI003985F624
MMINVHPSPVANSYVTEDEFKLFCELRDISITVDTSVLLTNAMDYLNALRWRGKKTDSDQPLPFPRVGIIHDNEAISSENVPANIKLAQCWLAIYSQETELMPINEQSHVVQETISVISVRYSDKGDGSAYAPSFPIVDKLLSDFINSDKYAISTRAIRC